MARLILLFMVAVVSAVPQFQQRYATVDGSDPLPVQYVPLSSLFDSNPKAMTVPNVGVYGGYGAKTIEQSASNVNSASPSDEETSSRDEEAIQDDDKNKQEEVTAPEDGNDSDGDGKVENEGKYQRVETPAKKKEVKALDAAVVNGPLTQSLSEKNGRPVLSQTFDPKKAEKIEDLTHYEITRTERLRLPNYSQETTVSHRNPLNPFTLAALQRLSSVGGNGRSTAPINYGSVLNQPFASQTLTQQQPLPQYQYNPLYAPRRDEFVITPLSFANTQMKRS